MSVFVHVVGERPPRMEEVVFRFPHISEQIFAELEDSSLARCC